jgi:peptide/nickel transport system permease protein
MGAFALRRVVSGFILIAVLIFLTFFVFNEIPTNPACLVVACGPHTTTTDAMIKAADHRLGIDRPVITQYADYAWHLVRHGDFGTAWTQQQSVRDMLGTALPVTASLVIGGMILMLLIAVPLGAIAATRPRTLVDRGLLSVSIVGLAIQPFVLGITIRDFFANQLHWSKLSYCPLTAKVTTPLGECGGPVDWASHLIVPWIVFALLFLPFYMRMIRVRLLETLDEPYVSVARAKGASETRVVAHHALRNAIGPVLPMLAIDAGTAITAAIYVETVFGLPGLGSLAVQAFSGRQGGFDLPLTAGIVVVVGTFVVLLNIASDVVGAWLDPRVREKASAGMIKLPRAVAQSPRARLALNIGLGTVAAVLFLVAVLHKSPPAKALDIGAPVKTLRPNWVDYYRVEGQDKNLTFQHGEMVTHVTGIQLGPKGWRVHATIENQSPFTIGISSLPDSAASYPDETMSIVAQKDSGGGVKPLTPLTATEFQPPLPPSLGPNQKWSGTFAGMELPDRGALYYVGFGQFTLVSPIPQQPFAITTGKNLEY